METFDWGAALAWLLGVFFVIGGIVNWVAPKSIRKDYLRWGYPRHFHYVTAVLELVAAGLLFFPETRLPGLLLASTVMIAAAATLLRFREYKHVIAPAIILLLIALSGELLQQS